MSENLFSKLARIMGKIDYLPKEGRNQHFNYKFVTDAAVYDTARGLLAAEGIAVLASMKSVEQVEFVSAKGARTVHTRACFEFVLADGETGQTYTCTWFSESDDQSDKGVNKCATAALKYWLLKTFLIPTGDDPDGDGEEDRVSAPKSHPAPKAAAPSSNSTTIVLKPTEVTGLINRMMELRPDINRAHASQASLKALGLEKWTQPYPGTLDTALAAIDAYAAEKADAQASHQ